MQTKDDLIRVYTHVKAGIAVRECLLLREKPFNLRNGFDERMLGHCFLLSLRKVIMIFLLNVEETFSSHDYGTI